MMFAEMPGADSIGLGGLGLAAVGAALGVVASMWGRAKSLFTTISGLAVRRVELPVEQSHRYVGVLLRKFRVSSNYVRTYTSAYYIPPDGDFTVRTFPYETVGRKPLVFWRGWWPLFYFPPSHKDDGPRAIANDNSDERAKQSSETQPGATLVFLRGTFDVDDILRGFFASQLRDKPKAIGGTGFYVYRIRRNSERISETYATNDPWYDAPNNRVLPEFRDLVLNVEASATAKALPSLVLSSTLQGIVDDVGRWLASRQWYASRQITWKRGFLFFGPPGTGKTAMVRALGHAYRLPVFVFELAGMTDNEFTNGWRSARSIVPSIVLFEDFDNVFHGRKNVTEPPMFSQMGRSGDAFDRKPRTADDNSPSDADDERFGGVLRFDTLINAIDGIEPCDGMLLIVTTNDVTKIDPAIGRPVDVNDIDTEFISTRPGRIDRVFRLGAMALEDKLEMVKRYAGAGPDAEELIEYFREHGADATPAQVRERCVQHALARYWQSQQQEIVHAHDTNAQ